MSSCCFTTLLEYLEHFSELEELDLSNNPLNHLDRSPLEYIPWHRLRKLDLSGCGVTELPEGFECCCELEELNLSNNPLTHLYIPSLTYIPWRRLKKLDLSGCGLTELPNGLRKCGNIQELDLSNNSFDHHDLLEKLNSGKVFSYSSLHKSAKELLEPTASGLERSKLTRIIFEDVIYRQRSSGG